mgnify:CR=1 FL=1
MLMRLMREQQMQMVKLRFHQHVAAAQFLPGDTEAVIFQKHWAAAETKLGALRQLAYPWVDWEKQEQEIQRQSYEQDRHTGRSCSGRWTTRTLSRKMNAWSSGCEHPRWPETMRAGNAWLF